MITTGTSPVTVASKPLPARGPITTLEGTMVTAIVAGVTTVSMAVAAFDVSARLCAVTWYVPSACGAVTVPSCATAPQQSM